MLSAFNWEKNRTSEPTAVTELVNLLEKSNSINALINAMKKISGLLDRGYVAYLVDACGGAKDVSVLLDVKLETVYSWKFGGRRTIKTYNFIYLALLLEKSIKQSVDENPLAHLDFRNEFKQMQGLLAIEN